MKINTERILQYMQKIGIIMVFISVVVVIFKSVWLDISELYCEDALIATDNNAINFTKKVFSLEHNDVLARKITSSDAYVSDMQGKKGWSVIIYYRYYLFKIIKVQFLAPNDAYNTMFYYEFTPCGTVLDHAMAR